MAWIVCENESRTLESYPGTTKGHRVHILIIWANTTTREIIIIEESNLNQENVIRVVETDDKPDEIPVCEHPMGNTKWDDCVIYDSLTSLESVGVSGGTYEPNGQSVVTEENLDMDVNQMSTPSNIRKETDIFGSIWLENI